MRKRFYLVISLLIALFISGCIQSKSAPELVATDVAAAQTTDQKATVTSVPESKATKQPEQQPIETTAPEKVQGYDLSYADAANVFTNADSLTGKIYASPFQIMSDLRRVDDKFIYFAGGYCKNTGEEHYAILMFSSDAPELKDGEIVYVYGEIKGTSRTQIEDGEELSFLMLAVNRLETEIPDTATSAKVVSLSFIDSECVGTQESLSIEVSGMSFSSDGVMLSTKTTDSAAKGVETYYMDIFAHQNGHFTWYADCDFWVQSGMLGFDNVPLRALDPGQDLLLEFFPFDGQGELIYPAIVIPVPLSKE